MFHARSTCKVFLGSKVKVNFVPAALQAYICLQLLVIKLTETAAARKWSRAQIMYGFQGYDYAPAWAQPFPATWDDPALDTQWEADPALNAESWQALQTMHALHLEAWSAAISMDNDPPPWQVYDPAAYAPFHNRPPPGIPTPWDDEAAMEASIEYFRRAFEATGIAIEKIDEVRKKYRVEALDSAVDFLQDSIETRYAVRAYSQVLHAALIGAVPRDAVQPIKAAIRDVAVLRCAAEADPSKREVYEPRLAEAFGINLETMTNDQIVLWSQLKLAYRKQLNFFMSNNQIENAKRGRGPREKRRRHVTASTDAVQEAAEQAAKVKALQAQLQDAKNHAEESKSDDDRAKVEALEKTLEAAEALQRKTIENLKTAKNTAVQHEETIAAVEADASSSAAAGRDEELTRKPVARNVRSPRLTAGDPVFIECDM